MQEHFIKVDGYSIRYLESANAGKTIVLIHGLGASAERWSKVIPILAKNYHIIAPDLIGFGHSDKPMVDYTPIFFSEFIKKFFKKMGIICPCIIGSSLGGQIIAEYASEHPDNVEKLILVSPAGMMKQSTPALDTYIMAALYPNELSAKTAFEMMEASGKPVEEWIVKGFIERMQLPNSKLAFMSTILGLKNSDVISDKLKNIVCPTLVIWGSKDPVIPIEHSQGFLSSIRNSSFHEMDSCGHTPYVQDPETFSSIVLDFLSKN